MYAIEFRERKTQENKMRKKWKWERIMRKRKKKKEEEEKRIKNCFWLTLDKQSVKCQYISMSCSKFSRKWNIRDYICFVFKLWD